MGKLHGYLPRQIYPTFLESRCWLDIMNEHIMPENFILPDSLLQSGTIWKQMGLTSFPKLLVKPVSVNQELNLHQWASYAQSCAPVFTILTTDGTPENTEHFPCCKSHHSLETESRDEFSYPLIWLSAIRTAKEAGVQLLLEQV